MTLPDLQARTSPLAAAAGAVALLIACFGLFTATPARAEAPSQYMQRVMNELVAAQRSRSISAFGNVLRKHMDVPGVGLSALGPHVRSLPKGDRPAYYNAMINFIAKYSAKEAPKYPVSSAVVTGQGAETATGTDVDTQITVDGTPYDVRWKVVRSGGALKVRDAQVIGVWATSYINSLFQDYIANNGNNPSALVVALNRY
ncbi:MAG: ABC transporter substrate-binding protein [Hyphomicrobium sp.]